MSSSVIFITFFAIIKSTFLINIRLVKKNVYKIPLEAHSSLK
jgi:hypothetical protein